MDGIKVGLSNKDNLIPVNGDNKYIIRKEKDGDSAVVFNTLRPIVKNEILNDANIGKKFSGCISINQTFISKNDTVDENILDGYPVCNIIIFIFF
jgi:hypothetical protein